MFASLLAWTSNGKLCWCIIHIDLKANSVWGEKRNMETSILCCATWILSLYFQHFCLSVCMPSIKPPLGSGFLHRRIYQQQQPVVPAHPAQTKDFNYKNKGCIYTFTFSKNASIGSKNVIQIKKCSVCNGNLTSYYKSLAGRFYFGEGGSFTHSN